MARPTKRAVSAPKRAKRAETPEDSVEESQEGEVLYNEGDYVCVWDDGQKEGYSIALLLEGVQEEDKEVQAHFFQANKSGGFNSSVTGVLETKLIVIALPEANLTLAMPPKKKAAAAKKGSKKAQEEEQEIPTSVVVDAKLLKQIKAAIKKFVPPESEGEEDEEEEEEESEDERPIPKRGRSVASKKSTTTAKVAPKILAAKKKPAGRKPAKEESEEEEPEEEEADTKPKTKVKTVKGAVEVKIAKPEKKPTVFKKGKWNPNVEIIEKCHQLESDSLVPNFECSSQNSNREVIRAAMINNPKLLEKILRSDHKITTLTDRWGVENRTTALMVALESGKKDILIPLLEHLTDPKKSVKFGTANKVYLKQIDTGFNDKYAYGVATRRVALSRGGRQGNNALVEDQGHRGSGFDTEHIEFALISRNVTVETLKTVLSYYPAIENQFINKIGVALRYGNNEKAAYLMERCLKNGGYGLSEHFIPALTGKNAKAVAEIKKVNCTKKAFGMGNFTPIHAACLNPNAEVLKHILTLNPEYLVTDDSLRKPVHYAACCRSAEPIKVLASQNVDTRENDNMKTTPIMYAARAGSVEVVKFLLAPNKSVPSGKDRHSYSAIHYAAENGHTEIIKLLLDHGVKIAHSGPDRQTALHIAAAKGNFEMVKFLIERGAKVTAKDKFKRTPLLLAAKNGNLKVASYLLQRGAPFDEGDSSGNTPLHYACAYGYTEMIDLLIKSGANPNSVNSWNLSPTAVALMKSYFSCLRKMLDNPQTNVNCIDDEGRTLVSNAIKTISAENFAHVAFLLRDKKADPNIADAQGLTAFDYLCKHNPDSLAQAEVKKEMNLEEINELKAEKKSLYKKYFRLLLEAGSDINHRDLEGLTPIFRAVQSANIDGVNMLLERPDIDLNIMSKQGQTFLHFATPILASDGAYVSFTKILDRLGSSAAELLNKYSHDGKTALHVLFKGFVPTIHSLESGFLNSLEQDAKLAKKPRSDAVIPENTTGGLLGGARTLQTARKSVGFHRGFGFGGMNQGGFASQPGMEGIVLTTHELERLKTEAQNKFKDKMDEFFDILRLFRLRGGDFKAKQKKPIQPKQVNEDGEEIENDDLDYGFATYFDAYRSRALQAILSKIDIPAKDFIPADVGESFLHLAADCHYLPLYKFLVEEAKVDVNAENVHGENELFTLVKKGLNCEPVTEVIQYLADQKVGLNDPNLKQDTPLLVATVASKLLLLKKLLELGVNPDSQNKDGNYPLLQAVKNKSLAAVETLLSYKANPNLLDSNKRTSIHWAINLSNADADASNEIENCLLSSGADMNFVDSRGRTPLHYAFVKIGDPFNTSNIDPIETVSNILSRPNAKVDVRDEWGNTPLNYAAQRGSIISGLYLLKHHANINNVNADGNTPLNECLINGHQNMSIFLIQKEADLTIPVKVRTAEMKNAELNKKLEEEKKKLEQEAHNKISTSAMDVEKTKDQIEYESSDEDSGEYKAKRKAIDQESDTEIIEDDEDQAPVPVPAFGGFGFGFGGSKQPRKSLKARGPIHTPNTAVDNLKFKPSEKECSTFSIAIRRNWQSVAFLMLEFGFNLSLAILDCFSHKKYNYVYTLLLKKADSGVYQTTNAQRQNLTHLFGHHANSISTELYDKILGKLESKNLDFKSKDALERTSLHYACQSGSIKFVRALLDKGLDINARDSNGVHPLGHVLTKSFHIAQDFASFGKPFNLDLNATFTWGGAEQTALTYIVAQEKSIETFGKLHELGADVNKPDSNGFTPLFYFVKQNKFLELQAFIRDFQVDLTKVDNEGRTIIHHAVRSGDYASFENVEMLQYLATLADFNKPDKKGFTPLDYASLQQSGRMTNALEKLGARSGQASIRRAPTSMLNELEFPSREYNFEEDFEKFLEECKQKAEIKKQTFTEKIPVDRNAVGNYEVVYENGEPFDTYMVKVEISYGYYSGNTFYKMQILREKVRDIYILFTKWGRVGTDGQYQQTPFSKLDDAKKEWCSIFKSKSGNLWEDRHNFVKNSKKYRLVPFTQKTKMEDFIKAFNYKDSRIPQPTTQKELYKFMRRVCNYKILTDALTKAYRYDNSILPLHLLSRERIEDARAIVSSIENTIKDYEQARQVKELEKIHGFAEELTKLTSEFYELIPSSNHKDRSIPPITSTWQLQQVQRLINDLGYFEIVIKLIGAATLNMYRINPIDYCYKSLGFKTAVLDPESDEFKILKKYMNRGSQGQSLKGRIHNIYAVERERERENIKKWEKYGNKMLLWHGTKPENVVGILQTGFRIAPADTNHSGAMFGSGVYFADMFGKSLQYTSTVNYSFGGQQGPKPAKKYLFLCEVALGDSKQLYNSEQVTGLPDNTHQSVMGVGRVGPNPAENLYLPNGAIVPLGSQINNPEPVKEKPVATPSPFGGFNHNNFYWALQFNEYVVYDTTQIRVRYLIELNN